MKGYKVFNPDFTCRGFKYEIGKTYTIEGNIECCKKGFHFCKELTDCFNYYDFDYNKKFAIIEANDKIITDDDEKYCTNNITIVKELSFTEVCEILDFSEKIGKIFIDSFNVSNFYKEFGCVLLGGVWHNDAFAGPFYWHLHYGSSQWNRSIGACLTNDNKIKLFEWGYDDKPIAFISEERIEMMDDYEINNFTEEEIVNYCNYLKENLFEYKNKMEV